MTREPDRLYGAIEAGGTKFVCAVGHGGSHILEEAVIPTRDPESTLRDVTDFFRGQSRESGPIESVGVGSFGPLDIDRGSDSFGQIIETSKAGWSGVNLVTELEGALGTRIVLDTDVNCALAGEAKFGAGRGYSDLVYLTVGTGIGGGVLSHGEVVYGNGHPEIGHLFVPKQADDSFEGGCPFHGDRCVEGLASGPAIRQRWGDDSRNLPHDHPAWGLEARYLAMLCHNLFMTTAPERIILGGGVMAQTQLFPLIRDNCNRLLNGFGAPPGRPPDFETAIVPAALSGTAGILGAFLLAATAPGGFARIA